MKKTYEFDFCYDTGCDNNNLELGNMFYWLCDNDIDFTVEHEKYNCSSTLTITAKKSIVTKFHKLYFDNGEPLSTYEC
jgi:hypothetical protein